MGVSHQHRARESLKIIQNSEKILLKVSSKRTKSNGSFAVINRAIRRHLPLRVVSFGPTEEIQNSTCNPTKIRP
jgi:hypothetical protein